MHILYIGNSELKILKHIIHLSLAVLFYFSIDVYVYGQKRFQYTESFDETLDRMGLYYYEPTEAWLHPVPQKIKEYGPFDMILHSTDKDVEIRYRFKELHNSNDLANHPQLDLYQYVATLASNNQSPNITLTEIEAGIVDTVFNADWGLYADFTPKESLSRFPFCRMIALYKEEQAMIYSMVFYKEEVPEYFDLPISFKEEMAEIEE